MIDIIVTVECNMLLTPLDRSGYLKIQVIFKKDYKNNPSVK